MERTPEMVVTMPAQADDDLIDQAIGRRQ
jgi:hypothetical protein